MASRSVVILADGLFPVAVNANALHSATISSPNQKCEACRFRSGSGLPDRNRDSAPASARSGRVVERLFLVRYWRAWVLRVGIIAPRFRSGCACITRFPATVKAPHELWTKRSKLNTPSSYLDFFPLRAACQNKIASSSWLTTTASSKASESGRKLSTKLR